MIQVSSIGGVHAFPGIGLYHASKWGLEGFTQALAGEVAGLGIKVTIVEPGGFSTDWAGPSSVSADEHRAYQPVRDANADAGRTRPPWRPAGHRPGDPGGRGRRRAAAADLLRQEPLDMIRPEYERRLAEWDRWDELSKRAHGEGAVRA